MSIAVAVLPWSERKSFAAFTMTGGKQPPPSYGSPRKDVESVHVASSGTYPSNMSSMSTSYPMARRTMVSEVGSQPDGNSGS